MDSMIKSNKKYGTKNNKKLLIHSPEGLKSCLETSKKRIPELLGEFTFQFDKILIHLGSSG